MKKQLFILGLALASTVHGADVVLKTAGTAAADQGFSIQDNANTELFTVEGDGAVAAKKGRIQDKSGFLSPVGSITMYAHSTAPAGWLICDGSGVSRSTYADLYALIGTAYGTGDGSTTFNLPDMSGKGVKGYKSTDSKFDALGENGGEDSHTILTAEMPSHDHSTSGGDHTHETKTNGGSLIADIHHEDTNHGHTFSVTSGNQNAAHQHSIDPPNTSTSTDGTHQHNYTAPSHAVDATSGNNFTAYHGQDNQITPGGQGAHPHTVDITDFASASNAQSHGHDVSGTTGTQTQRWNHDHPIVISGSTESASASGTVSANGGGGAINVLDSYITMNYIIKF